MPPKRKKTNFSQLHKAAFDLLDNRNRNLTIEVVAKDTGLTVSWLRAFSANQIVEPSALKLETLYNYLAEKPLKVASDV